MINWLLRRWIWPFSIAVGVAGVIALVSWPGFRAGQVVVERYLGQKETGGVFTWSDYFAEPIGALDEGSLRVFLESGQFRSHRFEGFSQTETRRARYYYEVTLASSDLLHVEFVLTKTGDGWRIEGMSEVEDLGDGEG